MIREQHEKKNTCIADFAYSLFQHEFIDYKHCSSFKDKKNPCEVKVFIFVIVLIQIAKKKKEDTLWSGYFLSFKKEAFHNTR